MAIIKRIASKWSLKKIIDYVLNKDKTAEKIISGKDCSPENSLSVMNATKKLYNKTDGRSYNHIIQSFKPGEVEPGIAHEIGKGLAEKQYKGYEVLVATHIDKDHIHNHFVVNSVSFLDGRKIDSSKQSLIDIKKESNRICKERGLSVIEIPYARNVYSMSEYKLAEKGMSLWKEQLRAAIDEAKENSRNIVEMKDYLEENFNIDMKIQNKNLSFLHPDKQKYCRGSKLGNAYTKDEIMMYFERGPEEKKSERSAANKLKIANPEAAKKRKEAYEEWKKIHPEEAKAAYERWKEDNPEEAAERKKAYERWKKAHPKEAKASYEKWEKESIEVRAIIASYKEWMEAHPEEAKTVYKKWEEAHPKDAKEVYERWKEDDPEEVVKKIKESYENWEKENPLEAKEAYEEWWKAHMEEGKEAYEKWKAIYLEEARAASEQKYLEWKAANQPNIILNKVGFGIEGITNKISRDIEKEKIRVDETKIRKDRAKEKYRVRDKVRGTGRERDRERE